MLISQYSTFSADSGSLGGAWNCSFCVVLFFSEKRKEPKEKRILIGLDRHCLLLHAGGFANYSSFLRKEKNQKKSAFWPGGIGIVCFFTPAVLPTTLFSEKKKNQKKSAF